MAPIGSVELQLSTVGSVRPGLLTGLPTHQLVPAQAFEPMVDQFSLALPGDETVLGEGRSAGGSAQEIHNQACGPMG